jgi:hypothetical protein
MLENSVSEKETLFFSLIMKNFHQKDKNALIYELDGVKLH